MLCPYMVVSHVYFKDVVDMLCPYMVVSSVYFKDVVDMLCPYMVMSSVYFKDVDISWPCKAVSSVNVPLM